MQFGTIHGITEAETKKLEREERVQQESATRE